MVYCQVTCDYPQYVSYESAPVTGTLYLPIPAKLCNLVRCKGTTILLKVASVIAAESASPAYLKTCCGATIPLVSPTGTAVTGTNLTLNDWYEIRISNVTGVAQATVNNL